MERRKPSGPFAKKWFLGRRARALPLGIWGTHSLSGTAQAVRPFCEEVIPGPEDARPAARNLEARILLAERRKPSGPFAKKWFLGRRARALPLGIWGTHSLSGTAQAVRPFCEEVVPGPEDARPAARNLEAPILLAERRKPSGLFAKKKLPGRHAIQLHRPVRLPASQEAVIKNAPDRSDSIFPADLLAFVIPTRTVADASFGET
ncbi:hypothetical protein FF011L_14960 [Roseimaritima multifibrata]|uniref:Uncharacterized protein n=1 Tax=Roseimaritima multifibrata TaxID=1930274 RepID=A0A517MD89_9BACT|nr:hypothetical protein FF011L_14960 [Roseimaritima multifibrata]